MCRHWARCCCCCCCFDDAHELRLVWSGSVLCGSRQTSKHTRTPHVWELQKQRKKQKKGKGIKTGLIATIVILISYVVYGERGKDEGEVMIQEEHRTQSNKQMEKLQQSCNLVVGIACIRGGEE